MAPHLPFPRPSPPRPLRPSPLPPGNGHQYFVVLVVRGTAVTSGRINAVKLCPMDDERLAGGRGVGGATRLGLHGGRRAPGPAM